MNERDIVTALQKRYSDKSGWALIPQVRNQTGFGTGTVRTADAIAFQLWPSRGLDVEGFEIKVSKSDWQRELADPAKADGFIRHCHKWWIVAPADVVAPATLPSAWGLMRVGDGGGIRVTVQAPRREAEPIPHRMMVAVMRQVARMSDIEVAQIRREVSAEVRERLEAASAVETGQMRVAISEFAAATGIDIRRPWDKDKMIDALTQHDADRDLRWKVRRIASMGSDLERLLSDVRQIVEADDE